MRSFIASALIIAGVLIAQQWVVKSTEAQSHFSKPLAWTSLAHAATTAN